jgi:hypothetical protein
LDSDGSSMCSARDYIVIAVEIRLDLANTKKVILYCFNDWYKSCYFRSQMFHLKVLV